MLLTANVKRLAQPLIRLLARGRRGLDSWREIGRAYEAAKRRPTAENRGVAVHEAGHAALQIALGVDCKLVTICPWQGMEGFSAGGSFRTQNFGEQCVAAERAAFHLRSAIVCYAGAEAERQLMPAGSDPESGALVDNRIAAADIVEHIGGDSESTRLLFALAKRRCALLVTHYQPEIRALAAALEAQLTLSGRAARKVFMRSLKERSGRLMTFKTDPILNSLTDDEAFQAFRRGMDLH